MVECKRVIYVKSKNLASQSILFKKIMRQYLFFNVHLSWDSLSNLSQETVLRHTTIDMLMKMGCGNTFGKLPWPEVRQDCSFSYKYICSLKEKKPGNCYLQANLTVKTLAMHGHCVKSEWTFKFVYFTVSKVWVVPVDHNLCESSSNCTYKLYI